MERIPLHYMVLSRLRKERILLYLGWMDIDYAESPPITNASTPTVVALYERCERSNPLNVMFIKPKITTNIRGIDN